MQPTNRITDRIDAITNIPPGYRTVTPPAPRSVKIELTSRCNFRCTFCARGDELRPQNHMDRNLFEDLLLEMREAGVEEIGLFYLGESFLVPWLEDAIRFAKHSAEFPYVFLTTNGSLATKDRVRACIDAGLDSLKFSLNYADVEQFADIARVKPVFFERMMRNIKDAAVARAESKRDCGLYASYIAYDGEQGARMMRIVGELRPYLDEIYALPLYNQAGLVSEALEGAGWHAGPGNRGRLGALRDPVPCWAVFTEGHITYDGKLSACCFDHNSSWDMGDLTQTDFMKAWHSEKFQALRAAHLSGNVTGTACEQCAVLSS